jgi:hypothetical protein
VASDTVGALIAASGRSTTYAVASAIVAILAIVTAGAVAGRSATGPGTGPAPASLFVSPSGNDGAPCSRAAPCATWNRAYQRARPGTVIELAGGTYPGQLIASRPSLRNLVPGCSVGATTNCIVFRPAARQTVLVDGTLNVHGSSVYVQGAASSSLPIRSRTFNIKVTGHVATNADSETVYPDHVVFQGIDATNFGAFSAHDVTFRNMDVGPATITTNCTIREGDGIENKVGYGDGIEVVPRNVLIEGMLIHNQNADEGRFVGDCHYGGLFIVSANGLTIRNSAFSQNVVYNIQVQNFNQAPPPTNVTIENTLFGCAVEWLYVSDTRCDGQHDIQFNADSRFSNWLIRHNSFVGGIGQYVPGASYSNFRVVGNAGGRIQACFEGMSFAYNAWTEKKCSRTDRTIPRQPYVSAFPGSEDMRLAAGTPARALVPPDARSRDLALTTDMEGRIRPLRFPRDAGALQRDTAFVMLGRSIGSVVMGMARERVLARYGPPRSRGTTKIGIQKIRARTDGFVVPGGRLNVTTVGDRVVGLATRSPYYTTTGGLGPASLSSDVPQAGWEACKNVLRRRVGSVVVTLRLSSGKRPKVTELSMLRRLYDEPCAEKAKPGNRPSK